MPKNDEILKASWNTIISENLRFWRIHFFDIKGVEVGSKNRSKIDVKNDAETESLGNSIFIDF